MRYRRSIHRTPCLLVALLLVTATGCPVEEKVDPAGRPDPAYAERPKKPKEKGIPSLDPTDTAKAALEAYDTDGNGRLDAAELDAAPALRSAMKDLDINEDGAISGNEIAERVRNWQAILIASDVVVCPVRLDGQPLVGATVRFIPEPFLGEDFLPAEGMTDRDGFATVSMKDAKGITIPFGFYRIEVSKQVDGKELLRPRYNTETTLGMEVYRDGPRQLNSGLGDDDALLLYSSDQVEAETPKQVSLIERVNSETVQPMRTGEDVIVRLDYDTDTVLTIEELQRNPGTAAAAERLDLNGDGHVTRLEVDNRIESWRGGTSALTPLRCLVTLDGEPVENATVRLVPEVYPGMAELIRLNVLHVDQAVPVGLTDESGEAQLLLQVLHSADGMGPNGVPWGIYRVEISKLDDADQETIQPRYNKATHLGVEVAPDIEQDIVTFAMTTEP